MAVPVAGGEVTEVLSVPSNVEGRLYVDEQGLLVSTTAPNANGLLAADLAGQAQAPLLGGNVNVNYLTGDATWAYFTTFERIMAAPSAMRRSASPRLRAPQTNGVVKACLST